MSLDDFEFDHARAAVFDSLADGWDERVARPSTEALSQLIDSIEINGKVVLDIGSGTGVLLSAVTSKSPAKWIACDLSQRMLDILRERHEGRIAGLETLRADAHCLPLCDDTIDVVLCNGVYPHFRDKRRALLEIRRVLRPSGALIINHFVGRDTVNRIHGSSENEVLRVDLLPPACELVELLRSIGFVVLSQTDTGDLYRVVATLPAEELDQW